MAGSSKRRGLQDESRAPRTRAPNFLDSEKDLLIEEIIPRFKEFLENKRQDAVPQKVKDAKWEEATIMFNTLSGKFVRTTKQLKDLWGNLKATARAAVAGEKVEKFATGGGQVIKNKAPTPRDLQVLALLGESGIGLDTQYGGDAVQGNGCEQQQEATVAANPANPTVLLPAVAEGDDLTFEVVYEEQDIASMNFGGIEVEVPVTPQVVQLSDHNWSTHSPLNLYTKKPSALRAQPLQPSVIASTSAEPGSSHGSAEGCSTSLTSKKSRSISEEVEWAQACKKRTPSLQKQQDDEKKKELAEAKIVMAKALAKFLENDEKIMAEKLDHLKREEERKSDQMKKEEERKAREEERKEALFQLELEKQRLEVAKLKRELGEK